LPILGFGGGVLFSNTILSLLTKFSQGGLKEMPFIGFAAQFGAYSMLILIAVLLFVLWSWKKFLPLVTAILLGAATGLILTFAGVNIGIGWF